MVSYGLVLLGWSDGRLTYTYIFSTSSWLAHCVSLVINNGILWTYVSPKQTCMLTCWYFVSSMLFKLFNLLFMCDIMKDYLKQCKSIISDCIKQHLDIQRVNIAHTCILLFLHIVIEFLRLIQLMIVCEWIVFNVRESHLLNCILSRATFNGNVWTLR